MTSQENFRSRSQFVRQAARAHMLEIRRARTSKHTAAARPDVPLVQATAPASQVAVTELADAALTADAPPPPIAETAEQAAVAVCPDVTEDAGTGEETPAEANVAVAPMSGDPAGVPADTQTPVADDLEVAAVASAALAEPSQDQVPAEEPGPESSSSEPRKPARKSAATAASDGPTVVRKTAVKKPKPPRVAESAPAAGSSELQATIAELAEEVCAIDHPATEGPELIETSSDAPPAGEHLPDPMPPDEEAIALADQSGIQPPPSDSPVASEKPVARGTLQDLPGAGPGLIWMLEQCSVATMQELAETDAAELSRKLGLVGQILNVQTWVDFARTQISDRP